MDGEVSDRSPPLSEKTTASSWLPGWETEDSSLSALNIDGRNELHNLVEDKEVAAKAVAFVVNSTRKGIVPLCADVANLMRAKYSLDRKVARLRSENNVLRSTISGTIRNSNSCSPAPANQSYSNYSQHSAYSPPYTHSSQSSSITSTSPHSEGARPSDGPPPRLHRTSAFSVPNRRSDHHNDMHNHVTVALVHHDASSGSQNKPGVLPPTRRKRHQRKNSLPEMISEPHGSVKKVSPRANKVSAEVQCALEAPSGDQQEQQFRETLGVNARLAEELGAAKKEIEILRGKLREFQMKELAGQFSPDLFHLENERSTSPCSCPPAGTAIYDSRQPAPAPCCQQLRPPCPRHTTSDNNHPDIIPDKYSFSDNSSKELYVSLPLTTYRSPVRITPPLDGCLCSCCVKMQGVVRKKHVAWELCGGGVVVAIGDRVVVTGHRCGVVKYVGHIEQARDVILVFVGLLLDAPVGCHDGELEGKRYFSCEKNCGTFVPLHDLICVLREKSGETLGSSAQRSPSHHQRSNKDGRLMSSGGLKLLKESDVSDGHLV